MSKTARYSKSYGKRITASHASNMQFEQLFAPNSNKPSATKSAATVGKWGITSFTSIRSSNINVNVPSAGRREPPHGNKRMRVDVAHDAEDPFVFNTDMENAPAKETVLPSKPNKFFKSRSVAEQASRQYVPKPMVEPAYNTTKPAKRGRAAAKEDRDYVCRNKDVKAVVPKKFFTTRSAARAAVEEIEVEDKKPPIKLRIFKDKVTSNFVSETKDGTGEDLSAPPEPETENDPVQDVEPESELDQEPEPEPQPEMEVEPEPKREFQSQTHQQHLYEYQNQHQPQQQPQHQNLPAPPVDESISSVISECGSETNHDSGESLEAIAKFVQGQLLSGKNEFDADSDPEPAPKPALNQEPLDWLQRLSPKDEGPSEIVNGSVASASADPHQTQCKSNVAPLNSGNTEQDEKNHEQAESLWEKEVEAKPEEDLQMMEEDVDELNERPSVSTRPNKRGSIFKSRTLSTVGTKKRLALYKHKWHDDDEKKAAAAAAALKANATGASGKADMYSNLDEEFADTKLTRVTKLSHDERELDADELITSVKCNRKVKEFYTVIRNVKKAHQIQESGEFQEFNDDVEYILDTIQNNNSITTRCLSAVSLASKCMVPAFRMHLRAHNTVAKFFRALNDAPDDPSLALCTATVMFILSQDRLNMDLDRDSLELMLNLLDTDPDKELPSDGTGLSSPELIKNKEKVRELCEEMQRKGHAIHLNLDNITAGQLAMETLLSLTSKRAGEWFKEELRELGGLDHIVHTISECVNQFSEDVEDWTDALLDKLRKVDRCLRVLENITSQNEANQNFLLDHKNGQIMDILMKLYHLCDQEVPLYPAMDINDKDSTGVVLRETLLTTMKVLLNLTHDFNSQCRGSQVAGQKVGMMDVTLHCLLQLPRYIPEKKRFDYIVMAMSLLINMVEHSPANRSLLFRSHAPVTLDEWGTKQTAVEALIALFYEKEENARVEEARTDEFLDGKEEPEKVEPENTQKTQEEFVEETIAKLLQKAGRHMEDTMVAAYTALLLGYLIKDDQDYLNYVRQQLPDHKFTLMVAVLKKLFNFMNLTATAVYSTKTMKSVEGVIKFLENCDGPVASSSSLSLLQSPGIDLDMSS